MEKVTLGGTLGFKTLSDHQRQTLDGIATKVDAAIIRIENDPLTD